MSLEVSNEPKKKFELATELIQPAVLADIVDQGQKPNPFKPGTTRPRCYFVWVLSEKDTEGRNKRVFESFTVSIKGDRSRLRARLKEMGKLPAEGEKLDLEALIGSQRTLVLAEQDGDEGPYISITATMKPTGSVAIPEDFKRKKDQTDGE